MKYDAIKLGTKIRAYREKKKVTLNELSKLTGIAASNLSSIELDKSSPTLSTLMKIASAFGMKVGAVLDEALYRKAVLCRPDVVAAVGEPRAEAASTLLTAEVAMNRMDGRVMALNPGRGAVSLKGEGKDRLLYCLEGEVTAWVDDEVFFFKKGEALYLLPEASARLEGAGNAACSVLVVSTPAAKETP